MGMYNNYHLIVYDEGGKEKSRETTRDLREFFQILDDLDEKFWLKKPENNNKYVINVVNHVYDNGQYLGHFHICYLESTGTPVPVIQEFQDLFVAE